MGSKQPQPPPREGRPAGLPTSPPPPRPAASQRSARRQNFHELWTACVGTEQYDKAAWRATERQLKAAGLI